VETFWAALSSAKSNPAFWSAMAAIASAISAFLVMRIQRTNLLESVRPELVLMDWERSKEGAWQTIYVKTVKNIGRGAAFNVRINAHQQRDGRTVAGMNTALKVILAPGEEWHLPDPDLSLYWDNVPEHRGLKWMTVTIKLLSWDSRGHRHLTRYDLGITNKSDNMVAGADLIVPGVSAQRSTTSRSRLAVKLYRQLRRMPGIGGLVPNDEAVWETFKR
jgi:hypothetical protein